MSETVRRPRCGESGERPPSGTQQIFSQHVQGVCLRDGLAPPTTGCLGTVHRGVHSHSPPRGFPGSRLPFTLPLWFFGSKSN